MPLTNTWKTFVVDAMVGSDHTSDFPDPIYFGLSSTLPAADGSGYTEPTAVSYARVAVVNNDAHWAHDSGSTYRWNVNPVIFATALTDWGPISYLCLFSASSGGLCGGYFTLSPTVNITTGGTQSFSATSIVFSAT